MSNQSDTSVKRGMTIMATGIFVIFLALVFLARAIVY